MSQFGAIWGASVTGPWVIKVKSLLQRPWELVCLALFWVQSFHYQPYFLLSTPDIFANRNELPEVQNSPSTAFTTEHNCDRLRKKCLLSTGGWGGQWLSLSSIVPGAAIWCQCRQHSALQQWLKGKFMVLAESFYGRVFRGILTLHPGLHLRLLQVRWYCASRICCYFSGSYINKSLDAEVAIPIWNSLK